MWARPLPTTAMTNGYEAHDGIGSTHGQFTRNQNNRENWIEEMRGSLMIVATVIATLTFQIAINPPGGVWQSDTDSRQGCAANTTCKAGTSVLAFGNSDLKTKYEVFILLCTISFSASQTIILFLITGFPLRNWFVMWVFIVTMCVSVICLAGAYIIAIWMVMSPLDKILSRITLYYALFLGGMIALLCLGLLFRSVFWLVKKLCRLFCCRCCKY